MGITKITQEIKLRVSANRLFKATVTESQIHLPKLIPNAIKKVELLHGDGGAGTIRKTSFADGYATYKMDEVNHEKYTCKYSLIEGPLLGDKLEKIHYDQKYVDSDGGCIVKLVTEYHTKGDIELKEEDIKGIKDQNLGFYAITEESLLANPNACV